MTVAEIPLLRIVWLSLIIFAHAGDGAKRMPDHRHRIDDLQASLNIPWPSLIQFGRGEPECDAYDAHRTISLARKSGQSAQADAAAKRHAWAGHCWPSPPLAIATGELFGRAADLHKRFYGSRDSG